MSLASSPLPSADIAPTRPVALRRFSALLPRAIVLGASTGGPQAITSLLHDLAPALGPLPVVVVLHMPAGFVAPMCADITRSTGLPSSVAHHGDMLRPGHVHFAAGPFHCKVIRFGQDAILAHSDAPPVNFCKPAVDVLFRSAAEAFGAATLGIVLTGMGTDGLAGAAAIVDAGGSIVAQDEESSVVWGMPGAVARAGLCSAVLPIKTMASAIAMRLSGPAGARP